MLGITAVCNCRFDTTGLLNTDFSLEREEPNQHFVKMRYLLENTQKYDAFCFGSSRVGNIDLMQIDNGLRYYNMTYSEGLPEEWLEDIRLLLKYHVNIRQILLGLDDFSFKVDPKNHETQSLRFPYHDNGNIKAYLSRLLRQPSKPQKVEPGSGSIYDIYGTGRPLHPWADERIERDISAHVTGNKFPGKYPPRKYSDKINNPNAKDRMEETIAALKELKELADENDIELIVFVNPLHQSTYLSSNLARFNLFKRRVADITDFYDFSGLNQITTNNYYYYETSHYRPMVGDMIIRRIFRPEQEADFGFFVTKDNVAGHLQMLEQQLENWK